MVCAPSLIPRKPGERVKADRRDALKLARSGCDQEAHWTVQVHRNTISHERASGHPADLLA